MRIYHYLRKRGLALFMALVMCLGFLPPPAAQAADAGASLPVTKAELQLDTMGFSGGTGTESDPYLISSAGGLRYLAQVINSVDTLDYKEKYFALTADIDLGGAEWTPIGTDAAHSFWGTFYGGGHTISNFTVSGNAAGLFGYVTYAHFYNLTIKNATVTASGTDCAAGALAAVDFSRFEFGLENSTNSKTVLHNCHVVESTVSADGTYTYPTKYDPWGNSYRVAELKPCAGGLLGTASRKTNIQYCTVEDSSIYSKYNAGGVLGSVTISSSTVEINNTACIGGTVSASSTQEGWAGGIVGAAADFKQGFSDPNSYYQGFSQFSIKNCLNTASVSSGKYAGGIFGCQYYSKRAATVQNCLTTGAVKNNKAVGYSSSQTIGVTTCYTSAETAKTKLTSSAWSWDGDTPSLTPCPGCEGCEVSKQTPADAFGTPQVTFRVKNGQWNALSYKDRTREYTNPVVDGKMQGGLPTPMASNTPGHWYGLDNFGDVVEFTEEQIKNGTYTEPVIFIYAYDVPTHAVTFDFRDGSPLVYLAVADGEAIPQTLMPDATTSDHTENGSYTFQYWEYVTDPLMAPRAGIQYCQLASYGPWNFSTPITEDITLYAYWGNMFYAQFVTSGGPDVPSQRFFDPDEVVRPVVPGYTISEWNYAAYTPGVDPFNTNWTIVDPYPWYFGLMNSLTTSKGITLWEDMTVGPNSWRDPIDEHFVMRLYGLDINGGGSTVDPDPGPDEPDEPSYKADVTHHVYMPAGTSITFESYVKYPAGNGSFKVLDEKLLSNGKEAVATAGELKTRNFQGSNNNYGEVLQIPITSAQGAAKGQTTTIYVQQGYNDYTCVEAIVVEIIDPREQELAVNSNVTMPALPLLENSGSRYDEKIQDPTSNNSAVTVSSINNSGYTASRGTSTDDATVDYQYRYVIEKDSGNTLRYYSQIYPIQLRQQTVYVDVTNFIVPDPTTIDGLDITKTADKERVQGGEELTYTITVTNKSTVDKKVTVTDHLPYGVIWKSFSTENEVKPVLGEDGHTVTWEPTVPAGGNVVLTIVCTVADDANGNLNNTAILKSEKGELDSSTVITPATPKPGATETVTVTFKGNGGAWTETSAEGETTTNYKTVRGIEKGTAIGNDKMPADPVRDGYTFKGWNTKQDGTGAAFTSSTEVPDNMTVYAQWTPGSGGGGDDPSTGYAIQVSKKITNKPETIKKGSEIQYQITVTNSGQKTLHDLVIWDVMDPGLTMKLGEDGKPAGATYTDKDGQDVSLAYKGSSKTYYTYGDEGLSEPTTAGNKTAYYWKLPGEFAPGDTVIVTYTDVVSYEGRRAVKLNNHAYAMGYKDAALVQNGGEDPSVDTQTMAVVMLSAQTYSDSGIPDGTFRPDGEGGAGGVGGGAGGAGGSIGGSGSSGEITVEGEPYKVTFNPNGGGWDGNTNSKVVEVEDPYDPELSDDQQKFAAVGDQMPDDPTREDYEFKGWNTKPDGTGDDFTDSTELTDDITVYAKWEFTGTGAKVTISGEKHWDDNNNATGKRPASITVKLMNGETVVDTKTVSVDKGGKWAYSFEASKYTDEGTQISYTIAEDPVTGYEKVANQEADGKYDLTNRIVSFGYKIEFYKDSTESAENKFGDPVTGTAPYGTVIAGLVTENILTAHKPSDASYGPGAVVTEDQQKTIEATGDNVIRVLYSKGTLRYSFVQHFIDRDGTTEVGFQAVTSVPTEPKAYGTGLAGLIPDGLKGNKTYGEGDAQKTYTFDKDTIKVSVGTAGEKSELKDHPQLTDDDTVIHLYYDVNMIDKDHPDIPGPDDTPDKDQIVFTYVAVADEDGTSHCFTGNAAEVKEVVTKNGAGQASPTNVPAPVVETGYSFAYWQEEGGSQELTDALLKRMSYGQDTTINAYWTKDEVRTPNLSVSKTVSVNGAAASTATTAKVGDALVYTVTVTNSGSGDATGVTLADNFTGTGTLIWLNGDPTATSFNVPAGRSEVFIAFYRIPSGDAEKTIMNSASIKGDPAQPATATVTVDKADEPPAETIDVTWVDGHTGKILDKKAYPKGTEAADIPDGDYPQPEAHQYYVFEGWAKETDAAGNILITATYRKLEATGGPTYEELRELSIQVTVTCETNATHERHDYISGLKEGSYDWQVAGNTCFLNIYPDLYVKEFPGTHSIEGIRPATIELTWEPAEQQPAPPEEDPQEEDPQEEDPQEENPQEEDPQEEDPAVTDGPAADEGPDTEGTEIIPADRLPEGTPGTDANADADTETNAGADTEPEDDGEAGMGEEVKQQTQSLESEPAPAGSAGGKWVLANGETSRTVTFLVSCEAAPGPDDPKPEFRKVTVIWMPGTVGGDPIDVVTVDVAKDQPAREALKLVRDPAAPTHEGYEFLRWSESNVDEANSLITITALWRELSDTQLDVTANAVTATYDGRPHPAEDVSVKDASGNDVPFIVEYNGSTTAPVNAGTYIAVIKVDGKEVGRTTVTINRRTLTITTGSGSKVYDGTPLTNDEITITNQADGESITGVTTGSQTIVGSSPNTYRLTWGNGVLESNYRIEERLGTLRVTAQSTIIPPTDPYYPPYNPGTPGTTIPDATTPLDPGTDIDDQDVPLAGAVGLNDTDHFAYIAGYENNTVRPTANITRAEVAAIFFRLMTEEFRIANWSTENTFSDVKAGDWFNNAVSTCVKAGIIKGYEDGTFRPGQSITRAEFAAIAARFLGPDADDEGVGDFADTADKWYSADVRKAAKAGWISGMGGSRFEPNANITRAQVMSIVNRMLDRTPDADHMLPTMKTWIDNPEGTWYYVDVQEATNGHDYTRDETNIETWTAIQAEKNWAEIEAEWAANNGASASKDDAQPVEADGEAK